MARTKQTKRKGDGPSVSQVLRRAVKDPSWGTAAKCVAPTSQELALPAKPGQNRPDYSGKNFFIS